MLHPRTIVRAIQCALVLSLALSSTRAGAQSLDTLIAVARRANPSINAARAAIARADALARAAEAWEAPRVGIEVGDVPLAELNPFAKGETMLMVEQAIPLFGQNLRMASAERLGAAIAENELAASQRELAARVEREYLALWLLDRRHDVNVESSTLAGALFTAVEAQYTVGRAPQSDLYRITIEIERLGTERKEIDEERNEARGRLNVMLHRDDTVQIVLPDTLARHDAFLLDSLEARIGEHPSLKRMEAMAAMSRAEADAQESMLDPMLMLRGGVSYAPEGHPVREASEMIAALTSTEHDAPEVAMEDPMHWGLTVSAMISIPIAPWSRNGPTGLAEARRLDAEEQLYRREIMKREMMTMLRRALSQARRAELRLAFHRRTQIPLIEKSLATVKVDYENGRVPFSSVIDSYSMLVMARMDAYMQEMESAMARSMIAEIAGAQQ